jgi:hypothetical protein
MPIIIPRYKLIMTYDIQSGKQAEYSQFVLGKLIPGIQELQLYILGVYHTVYGTYPARQTEFVAETWDIMVKAVQSERFEELETALSDYALNYNRKIVKFRKGFQL